MKLNLGCGSQVPEGWVNVDWALGARFAKIPFFALINRKLGLFNLDWDVRICLHDLRKTFPWEDATAEVIYCSHLLEHMFRADGRRFLEECHRVLRVGGIIRLVVPDFRHLVNEYVAGSIRSDDFLQATGVVSEPRVGRGLKMLLAPSVGFPHRCMYDPPRLLELLKETGFECSPRRAFDSDIDDILAVELEERTSNAVVIEGSRT